jgi:hypothetical protein
VDVQRLMLDVWMIVDSPRTFLGTHVTNSDQSRFGLTFNRIATFLIARSLHDQLCATT